MKKLFLSLLICNLLTVVINAQDYSEDGNYTINVSCVKAPVYTIAIPKKINISSDETCLTFYVKGDIYADQDLWVVFDSNTSISDSYSSVNVAIVQNKRSWSSNELGPDYRYSELIIRHPRLKAGRWKGYLNVSISLQGAQ